MSFRVSDSSRFLLFQRALTQNNNNYFRLSEQLSTQKRINRPSDDPAGARAVANFRGSISKIGQFQSNLDVAERKLTQSETALTQGVEVVNRAKELALQGANQTNSKKEREALADEVAQLSEQLLSLANTQVDGEYVFAGTHSDQQPFELDDDFPDADPAAEFNGSEDVKEVFINEDSKMEIQVNGKNAFMGDGSGDTVDLFQTLGDLEYALRNAEKDVAPGDPDYFDENEPKGIPQQLENLDIGRKQLLGEVTSIGAKTNRVELTNQQLTEQVESMKASISDIEDADVAEVAYEFQRAQLALQSTVSSAGSALNMPSLMDFLR